MKLTTHAQLSIEDQSWGHLHSTQKPHQPGREFECTYAFDSSLGLRVPCRTGQFWRIPVQLSYPTISGILWRRWCTLCFRKKRLGTYVWSWANLVGASQATSRKKVSVCYLPLDILKGFRTLVPWPTGISTPVGLLRNSMQTETHAFAILTCSYPVMMHGFWIHMNEAFT